MACSCGGARRQMIAARSSVTTTPLLFDEQGFVVLAVNDVEPCVAYLGPFRTATMYVVGYGTEHERVFHRGQATAANEWSSNHGGLPINKTQASLICAHIVTAVLAGNYPTLQEQV